MDVIGTTKPCEKFTSFINWEKCTLCKVPSDHQHVCRRPFPSVTILVLLNNRYFYLLNISSILLWFLPFGLYFVAPERTTEFIAFEYPASRGRAQAVREPHSNVRMWSSTFASARTHIRKFVRAWRCPQLSITF